ncbi:MAG: M23 family metallopeptidase [Pseudonocardiaceae bacterium]
MARHRSPSGRTHSDTADAKATGRSGGAHRIPTPGPAARGRILAAAVTVGAVAAAGHGFEQPERTESSTPLAFGSDMTAYTGLGGRDPIAALPLPEVLPAAPDTVAQDVTSLAKGQRIAEERALHVAAAERAAEVAAAAAAAQAEAGRTARDAVSRLRVATGDVVMPAAGRLTSGFGARWGTTHYGIDIANAIGTPIYATTDGVVVESGPISGFGMWVRLQHADGTMSIYGHINKSLVSEGQRVAAGEQIATMGNRGQSTGPHLHFEVWLNGAQKVNPLSWLRSNGVDI